jgi:hypothetical protein
MNPYGREVWRESSGVDDQVANLAEEGVGRVPGEGTVG